MKTITELPLDAQDQLRQTFHEYYIAVDPKTNQQYVRFMGENVSVASIKQTMLLQG